jgi:TraY domain
MAMTNKMRKRAAGGGRKPKGPINGNAGWLQARITEDLRARLEQAAAKNGRSLSQEAQVRLQETFDLPARMQKDWGPPDVRELARLISRVVRSVHSSVGANPFLEAGDLSWHRNAFTHAAVETAIMTLLASYKPAEAVETPPEVKKRASWVSPDQADNVTTPESVGLSCAMGLLDQLAIMETPTKIGANVHYGDNYYVLPRIRKTLGKPNE